MKLLPIFSRILSSTAVFIFAWLMVGDYVLETTHPLRYFSLGGYISQDQQPLADKFTQLKRRKHSVNTLLLGSSLPMCATACADARIEHRPSPRVDYDLFCYSGAHFLEQEIFKRYKVKLDIFNFSGNGCMISDAYKLWLETEKMGIKPKLIILAIAPRDFLDNLACKLGETAYYRFFEDENQSKSLNLSQTTIQKFADVWHFFKIRRDYLTLFTLLGSHFFNRAPDLYTATGKNHSIPTKIEKFSTEGIPADIVGSTKKKELDLTTYRASYLPIDMHRYKQELGFLRKILSRCRSNKTECLVVSMPVAQKNRAILPEEFRAQYRNDVTEAIQKEGCQLLYLTDSIEFSDLDFRDSVHPNGSGGIKVCREIAKKLIGVYLTRCNGAISNQSSLAERP